MSGKQIDLSRRTDSELLELYSLLLDEIRKRNLTSAGSDPVAALAERSAAGLPGVKPRPQEVGGHDAAGRRGGKIKDRRPARHNALRQPRGAEGPKFPYYRIQRWDLISMCWIDIQKNFPDPEKADQFVQTLGKRYSMRYRIIEVQRDERHPYEPGRTSDGSQF